MNRLFLLLLVICALSLGAYSQTEKPTTDAPATTAATSSAPSANDASDKVTVYIYRYKRFTGSALEPSIYVDEKKVAVMDNGRFFKVMVAPGKHTFQSNDKQSGMEIDLKSGEEYYLRVDIAAGFWKGHGQLTMIQKEQGAFEIKKLKPMDKQKIKDPTVAFTEDVANG